METSLLSNSIVNVRKSAAAELFTREKIDPHSPTANNGR